MRLPANRLNESPTSSHHGPVLYTGGAKTMRASSTMTPRAVATSGFKSTSTNDGMAYIMALNRTMTSVSASRSAAGRPRIPSKAR